MGWSGFYIVDISNRASPGAKARYITEGQVYDLWVEGSYAFVAEGWEGLTLVDVRDSNRPFGLGKIATRGQARQVQVANNCVYLLEAGGGLTILRLPSAAVTILEHPSGASVPAGAPATLWVRAYGRETLSYQWYQGETGDISHPVFGGIEPSCTIPAVNEALPYWVRVSSPSAVCDSRTAWLTPRSPVSLELLSVWPGYRRAPAMKVRVEGEKAYVVAGGLQIWDVSNPASPSLVGTYDPKESSVTDLSIAGTLAILACGDRVDILDISNPRAPARTGSYTNCPASSIATAGHYAYVRGGEMLRVLDFSNSTQPAEVGAYTGPWGQNIVVRGSCAYLPSSENGLDILDIANPAQIRRLGRCSTAGYAVAVSLAGDYAFVAEQPRYPQGQPIGGGLVVINVTNANSPRVIGRYNSPGDIRDVSVTDDFACLADASSGLNFINVSNPALPRLSSNFSGISAQTVTASGRRAYVAAWDDGVKIVDFSSLAQPRLTGEICTSGSAQDVTLCRGYAYVAEGNAGLSILDVRNPAKPVRVGIHRGYCQSVTSSDHHAFLAPFQMLDISDPTKPVSVSTFDSWCESVSIINGDVCLLGGADLRLLNISDPLNVSVRASCALGTAGRSIASLGSTAFVPCYWSGLQILDLSPRTEIKRVSSYHPSRSAQDVAVKGNFVYLVVAEESGLEVLNITDLGRPALESRITMPANEIALMAGNYACVTSDGLRVIDVADPKDPKCVGQHQLGTATFGIYVEGNIAYVAAGEYGLAIYRIIPQLFLNAPVQEGRTARFSWMGGPGVRLQTTANLVQPDWRDVPGSENTNSVRLPFSGSSSFFRLIRR